MSKHNHPSLDNQMSKSHVVIRNSDVNAVPLIEVSDFGAFTQTRMGGPFRKLGPDDRPTGILPGETLWVAQSGRGVIAECEIAELQPTIRIRTLEDIELLRQARRYGFACEYWDDLRNRIMKGHPEFKKVLYFNEIRYRCRRRLPPSDIFPLNQPRGAQSSWITFDPKEESGILALRGQPQVTGDAADLANYTTITNKVRNLVFQIWGVSTPIPPLERERIHYDHWIPKSLGGPGIYAENVVPLPQGANIRKSAAVAPGFLQVSRSVGLLTPEDEKLDWQLFPNSGHSDKARAVKRVTEHVRTWPVPKQKAFYFQILAHTIEDLPDRYAKAGLQVPDPL